MWQFSLRPSLLRVWSDVHARPWLKHCRKQLPFRGLPSKSSTLLPTSKAYWRSSILSSAPIFSKNSAHLGLCWSILFPDDRELSCQFITQGYVFRRRIILLTSSPCFLAKKKPIRPSMKMLTMIPTERPAKTNTRRTKLWNCTSYTRKGHWLLTCGPKGEIFPELVHLRGGIQITFKEVYIFLLTNNEPTHARHIFRSAVGKTSLFCESTGVR